MLTNAQWRVHPDQPVPTVRENLIESNGNIWHSASHKLNTLGSKCRGNEWMPIMHRETGTNNRASTKCQWVSNVYYSISYCCTWLMMMLLPLFFNNIQINYMPQLSIFILTMMTNKMYIKATYRIIKHSHDWINSRLNDFGMQNVTHFSDISFNHPKNGFYIQLSCHFGVVDSSHPSKIKKEHVIPNVKIWV